MYGDIDQDFAKTVATLKRHGYDSKQPLYDEPARLQQDIYANDHEVVPKGAFQDQVYENHEEFYDTKELKDEVYANDDHFFDENGNVKMEDAGYLDVDVQ